MRSKMLCINLENVKELDLSLNEILCLYKIENPEVKYNDLFSTYQGLELKKYIKIVPVSEGDTVNVQYVLREKSKLLLKSMNSYILRKEEVPTKKLSSRKISNLVNENLETFREKWKGLAPGSMGSKKSCGQKLTRWIEENPEYTFEDILTACDIYIKSFNGNYKYLQRADYFIFKKDGKEESSRLSAFIDEIDLENTDVDWTSSIN